MQLVFSARPAYGHIYPLIPLAAAARRAGHQVTFATTGAFLPILRRLGFPTLDVGTTIDAARDELLADLAIDPTVGMPKTDDGRPDLTLGGRLFIDIVAHRTAADLAPIVADLAPDVLVYEQYDVGAAVVAHAAGVPAVCHSLSPRISADVIRTVGGDGIERLWATHGGGTGDGLDIFTGDIYVDIFPSSLQEGSFLADASRLPMRSVPFAEAGTTLPAWTAGRRRRPLVYLTLGTVVATDDALRPVVEGLGRVDVDVLLALGSAAGTDLRLPANVHAAGFVDQPEALRHADLAVHHGGSGTLLGALAAGTPQLVLPRGADQFFNADLVTRAGLASVLEPAHTTPESVAAAVTDALAEERPAVEAVRAEMAAMPHPREVLAEILGRVGLEADEPAA